MRHDSVTSLLSNKSGHELVQGLEEYRQRNQEELARERLEAQVTIRGVIKLDVAGRSNKIRLRDDRHHYV